MGGGKSWASDEIFVSCQTHTSDSKKVKSVRQRKEIFESEAMVRFCAIVAGKMRPKKIVFAKMKRPGSAIAAKFKISRNSSLKFLKI